MDISEFQKRHLEAGETTRCTVCGRIVTTEQVDEKEWQYQSKEQKNAAPQRSRRGLPKEGDIDKRPYVFVHKDETTNVLCRTCYALQMTKVN
jgi:hypothetical protein